tara:strand:- start:82601 stop:83098 length:498 start_codon:yes stop_codon:yes gene_type:complete
MLTLNIILSAVLLLALVWVGYQAYRNYQVREVNKLIYDQLERLMTNVKQEVAKNKILLEKTQQIFGDGSEDNTFMSLINSPGYPKGSIPELGAAPLLSSLITVLIGKSGTMRLNLSDFENVEEEYVSLYVDPTTEELILSLNHDLASGDPLAMTKFGKTDDSTFH